MNTQKFAVEYKDLILGAVHSESIRPKELQYFLTDERNGEIQILEIDQSFDNWETMEVLYKIS